VAAGWVALAEQVERIDRDKFPVRDEEKVLGPLTTGNFWEARRLRDRLRSRLKIREPNHATAIPTIAAAVR
jgi:hypothetical protein